MRKPDTALAAARRFGEHRGSVKDTGAGRPPTIPGYVLHTPLGRGAYGEVWLGENRTTKRQVAVKFLHSRATLDWWLLDGETEKLAFLAADRRVVQLLDVGRDADPPFYVMEYVGRGSLARHLESVGPLPVDRAVATFEEIALGLMQVHAKGILHCDLKPSNILLDDELAPRLADFGQSRPLDDRSPTLALGTMFFMAPEQADPAAVPDARWDVYALGAVLYSMLEGRPPHHSEAAVAEIRAEPDLPRRLARYRMIVSAAAARPPALTRRIDKPLAQILARCLAGDPRQRFATVQEIVEALRQRREARSRRPMMVLGGLGPVLLLAVMAVFGLRGYRQATEQSADAIRRRAFESNKFAAQFIARSLEAEIRRYFEVVTEEAAMPAFQTAFRTVTAMPDLQRLAAAGPDAQAREAAGLVEPFRKEPSRLALDAHFRSRLDVHLGEGRRDPKAPRFVSMFALDADGTHLGAAYSEAVQTRSVGLYFAWRSYFHGGPQDLPRDTPRARLTPIDGPHLSAPFRSTTTNAWRVGVSVPLYETREGDGESETQQLFAGVLVLSVDINDFMSVEGQPAHDRFAVLVDARRTADRSGGGRIIMHPYFGPDPNTPAALPPAVIDRALLGRMAEDWRLAYRDPLAQAPGGAAFAGDWIAAAQPLLLPGALAAAAAGDAPDGLVVLVQERTGAATGPVVQLGRELVGEGLLALAAIALTVAALWFIVLRGRGGSGGRGGRGARDGRDAREDRPAGAHAASGTPLPLRDRSTLSETGGDHG